MAGCGAVPRIIHQTYRSRQVPALLAGHVEALKTRNPGWDYRFYDDDAVSRFIAAEYPPDVLRAYNLLQPGYGAARADLFRYLLMYRVGGVYLDLKSTALLPLDSIIRPADSYLLAAWRDAQGERIRDWGLHPELSTLGFDEFQQWHIICAPGHPYLRAVIDRVLGNIARYSPARHGFGKYATLRTTGPIAYSLAICASLAPGAHRLINAERSGLRYSVLEQPGTHEALLADHYSRQTRVPLTRIGMGKYLLWQAERARWKAYHCLARTGRRNKAALSR